MDDYHEETLPGCYFIGVELRTSNEPGKAELEIPQHWENFYNEHLFEKIPNKISNDVFGLYTNYVSDMNAPYSLIIGTKVSTLDSVPENMIGIHIPEGKYATIPVSGHFPDSLIKAWQKIWTSDLDRAYTYDFEVYNKDFHPVTNSDLAVQISLK